LARPLPYRVYLRTDRARFPNFCVCCGEETTEEYTPFFQEKTKAPHTAPLQFPLCAFCREHIRASHRAESGKLVAINVAVWGVAVAMLVSAPVPLFLMPVGAGGALYWRALQFRNRSVMRREACCSEGVPCRRTWYRRDIFLYSFSSETYAKRFRDANREKVVPDP